MSAFWFTSLWKSPVERRVKPHGLRGSFADRVSRRPGVLTRRIRRQPFVSNVPLVGAVLMGASALPSPLKAASPVDFNRDIRPILSENCFPCHGPDEKARKAKLRLDTREGAIAARKEGAAIVPGKSSESKLVERVLNTDPEEVMPPAKTGKKLTAAQVERLKQWIEQGAEYKGHWAFTAPRRPALPPVKARSWLRNEIDSFILARLEPQSLKPSPEADRYALSRRLSLDLVGLPPSIAEAEEFVRDRSSDAYDKLADRFLSSPAFGEHWARLWLDLARFADSAIARRKNATLERSCHSGWSKNVRSCTVITAGTDSRSGIV